VACFCIVYKVGSRYEGAGHTGATHILEHLMFKGTQRFNSDRGTEIARVLQRVGADFNATTWLDRTTYFETVPVEHLPLAVEIEADRMRGARVREEDLESERTVVLNELVKGENDPFDLLLKSSFAHTFLEHPYHHPTIGWRSDVENVTAAVLRRFYDTYYHPDNATVIVIGDIDERATLDEIERRFGEIPPAPAPPPVPWAREGRQRGERRFQIRRAGEVGWLALTWHVPNGLHDDLPALSVLAQVLSEGVTSRLHQKLVETNLCLGVHAMAWELHDPGVFQVFATISPGVEHAAVEGIIREELRALRGGALADEVIRARTQVRTDLAFRRESPAQTVSALSEAVAIGDWRRFAREMELVERVTREDVARVNSTYLTDDGVTVGSFVPEGPGGEGSASPRLRPQPCFLQRSTHESVSLRELPGGPKVAVLSNPHAPTVTIAGSLQAGRSFVSDQRFLVASVTAAMLERGTHSHTRLALARELEDHGLQLGVSASGDSPTLVSFSAQGLAEELPRLVELLIDVLRRPTFPSDELAKLQEQFLGGLARERHETFPTAFGALTRHLYPAGHAHHHRKVDVRERELRSVSVADLEAYHQTTYGPASLVFAVVGQVESDEVAHLLEDRLAGWEGGRTPPPRQEPPALVEPARELLHLSDQPNLDVFLGHSGRLLRSDPDLAPAMLANACLGQSTLTSRLGVAVRDRAGLTYGVYSRFFGTTFVPGPWAVYLSVAPDDLERAVDLTRSVVVEYLADGPTDEEIEDERQAQAGAFRVGLATNSGIARALVTVMSTGLPLAFLDEHPRRLLEVGRGEVLEALGRHIHPEHLVLTAAGSLADEE